MDNFAYFLILFAKYLQFYKLYLHPKFLAHQLKHLNSMEDLDYMTRGAKAIWGHIKDFADIRSTAAAAK